MKEITKEELDVIMRRFLKYIIPRLPDKGSELFLEAERLFLLGSFSALLETELDDITADMVPPIVMMCWSAGRPVASVGNWDEDAPDQRLRNASITWADRVSMFPRGGDEQWAN